jgi:hypothetical protein
MSVDTRHHDGSTRLKMPRPRFDLIGIAPRYAGNDFPAGFETDAAPDVVKRDAALLVQSTQIPGGNGRNIV